jgi:hypothetical protein
MVVEIHWDARHKGGTENVEQYLFCTLANVGPFEGFAFAIFFRSFSNRLPLGYGFGKYNIPLQGRVKSPSSEHQRLGLLDLRQRLHLGEHGRRHRAVDLDQRDGVPTRLVAAEMEGRDVDFGVAE